MEIKRCKTLILGATFYGISRLMRNPGDCILVERSFMIGSEFVDSFNECGGKKVDIRTEFGQRYKERLSELNLISEDGVIYPAPSLFLLCDYLKQISFNILFFTEIVQIEKEEEGYSITIFNSDGFSVIKSDDVVDTTSTGILHDCINKIDVRKSLNLVVDKPNSPEYLETEDVFYNSLAKTLIYRFPVALEDDYASARRSLQGFWRNVVHKNWGCNIMLTANTFAYRMPYTKIEIASRYCWIPSCGFDNLLHAVDEGQVC